MSNFYKNIEEKCGLLLTGHYYSQYETNWNTVNSHTEYTYRINYNHFSDIDYVKGFSDLLWLSNLQYYEMSMSYNMEQYPCIVKKYYKQTEMYTFVIN